MSTWQRTWVPLLAGTLPIVLLDQATKFWVRTTFTLYQSVPIVPHWLNLTYTANPGAAFSMFSSLPDWIRTTALSSISVLAATAIVVVLMRRPHSDLAAWALALILAGALGNLVDRLRYGVVLDFIDVHYYGYHYPVFNLADCAITTGVGLFLLDVALRKERRRTSQEGVSQA